MTPSRRRRRLAPSSLAAPACGPARRSRSPAAAQPPPRPPVARRPSRQCPRLRGAAGQPPARRRARRRTARSGIPASAAARSASSIPRTGAGARGAARRGLGAARRHPGPGRRRLDHRRRAQRDRPRRSAHRRRCGSSPLPAEFPNSNLNTAAFDREGESGSPARPASTAGSIRARGEMRVWRDPEGRGPYGIAATPDGRDLLCLARRQPPRADRPRDRRGDDHRAADRRPGRAAGLGRQQRQSVDLGMEWRPAHPLHSGDRRMAQLAARGRAAAGLCRLCRRSRHRLGDATSPPMRSLSFDPATERWTRYPGSGANANVRQILGAPRLGLPARIGPRPDHGGRSDRPPA